MSRELMSILLVATIIWLPITSSTAVAEVTHPACDQICKAAEQVDRVLEKRCICTDSIKLSRILLTQLIEIQNAMDACGCENVRIADELCGGFSDVEITGIDITPQGGCPSGWQCSGGLYATNDIEASIDFEAKIYGLKASDQCCRSGSRSCETDYAELKGEVDWFSSNPAVATVDERGTVTTKDNGDATIFAFSKDYTEIHGDVTIKVGETCNDEAYIFVQPGFTCLRSR